MTGYPHAVSGDLSPEGVTSPARAKEAASPQSTCKMKLGRAYLQPHRVRWHRLVGAFAEHCPSAPLAP